MTFPQFNFPSAGGGGFAQGFTGTSPVTAGKYMEALKRPLSKEEAEAKKLASEAEVYGAFPEFLKNLAWQSSKEGMEAQLEMARKDAFQKGQAGLMFSTLANIPQTIANAVSPYGGPVGARMAYEGMSRIPGIYSETMRNFPQIQVPASSYSPTRYF
jgi:hypothetical protein